MKIATGEAERRQPSFARARPDVPMKSDDVVAVDNKVVVDSLQGVGAPLEIR